MTGRIFQALLNVAFSLFFYFPGALHAILVVADHKANRRADRMARKAGRGDVAVAANVQVINVVAPPPEPASALVAEMIRDRERREEGERWVVEVEGRKLEVERRNEIVRAIAESPRRTVEAAVGAYRVLPEWAQPVTWGLAVGAPFGIIGGLLFLTRLSGK